MKKTIDQITEAILTKGAIPQERAQQISHFNRLFELFHYLGNYLEKSATAATELKENFQSLERLLAESLQFNFMDYSNHEAFARAVGRIFMATMNVDSSKISILLELIVAGIKPKLILKSVHFQVLVFILEFRRNLPPISYPDMNEMLQNLLKLLKKNNEIPLRIGCMKVFRYLIREQVNVNAINKAETYRLITKFFVSEKSDELRKEALFTLVDFLKQADATFLAPNYETLLVDLYKQLEETKDWEMKKACTDSIQQLLQIYIAGDMETMITALKAKKGKKEPPTKVPADATEAKDKFKIILNLLTGHLNARPNLRLFIVDIFSGIIYQQNTSLTASFLSSILELFFSHLNKMAFQQSSETFIARDVMGLFIIQMLVFLNNRQKFELYEYLRKKLVDFGKVYKETYLRLLNSPTNLNCVKNEQNMQHQSLIALRCFFALVQTLGSEVFEQINSPNQLCEPLSPFFYFNNQQFYLLGSHVLRSLFSENPKWQTNILSLILNLMTLDLAELESIKEICNISDPQFRLYASSIYGHSISLGNLLKHMDFNLHSIPYDIAMTMFEFAKGLVKSEYKSEDPQSEELHLINSVRYQAGWTLINSLLCLDVNWLKQEIKSIYSLWQDILGQKRRETANFNNFISELNSKRQALKGLLYFLKNLGRLHTDPVLKYCANLVINFYQQYIAPTDKELGFVVPKNHPDVILAKIELYSCLNQIQPKLISEHINALIQTSVEDLFSSYSTDFTPSLKGLMDSEDINIATELTERTIRFRLFNSVNIKKLQEQGIERNENHLLGYDTVFLKYQEKNYAFTTWLYLQQFEYVGRILAYHSFTSKNKINLLKYILGNQTQVLALKDQNLRNCRLQPFLLVTIFVAKKIREAQAKNLLQPVENEIVTYLRQMVENGFSSEDNTIRALASGAYSILFGIKTVTPCIDTLFKSLDDMVARRETSAGVAACIGFICKNNKFRVMEEQLTSISGLFQKASKNSDANTQIWLMHSLSKAIEAYQEDSVDVVRASFQFVNLQHMRQTLQVEYLWNSLYKALVEKLLRLVRKIPKLAEDKALFSSFHTQFWEVQHQVFPEVDLISADLGVVSNFLHLCYSSIFKSPIDEKKALIGLKQNLEGIYAYNTATIKVVLKTVETIMKDKKTEKIGKDYLLNHLIRKMNYFHTRKDYYIAETIEVLYSSLIEEKEKMTREACEKKLAIFNFVLFGESFELKQAADDDEGEEEKKKSSSSKNQELYTKEDQIDINLRTKTFILSCVENFLREWDVSEVEKSQRISFTGIIFNFVFKIITSSHDEFRAPGMQILMNLLSKIKRTSDEGDILEGKLNYEEQRNLLLKDYAAQIDSIVSQNIKNESKNTPEVNIYTFQILSKFFKIILNSDIGFIKKLITLVSKPLFANIKMTFQSFYSEKSTTSIQIRRIECLSKIYLFIQNRVKNPELRKSLFGVFPPILLQYLLQNIQAAILDSAVVLTASRKQIKSYNNYYLIYNGVKTSYDVKMHFYMLANFVKYYLVLSEAVNSIQSQVSDNNEELDAEQKEFQHKLKSNDKYLSAGPKMSQICYSVLVFQLCSNTSVDQEEQYLKKISTQMLDISLLKKINHKLTVLNVLKQLLTSRMPELLSQTTSAATPAIANESSVNSATTAATVSSATSKQQQSLPISFSELFAVLLPYLDYGLTNFDQQVLDITTLLLKQAPLLSSAVLAQAEQLLDLILARYLEKQATSGGSQSISSGCLPLIKSAFILKLSILKASTDVSSLSEKFAFAAYFIFSKLALHFSYADLLPLRRAFIIILKEKLAQLNNEEGHKAQESTACTITDLILHEIEKNPAQSPKQNTAIVNYLAFHSAVSVFFEYFSAESSKKLNGNFSYVIGLAATPGFLGFIRNAFNDSKQIDEQTISSIFLIASQVVIQLKNSLGAGQQVDVNAKNSVIEVLKIFLLANAHGSDAQRKNSFEFFLRFFMLFVNQRFSQPDTAEILQLVNQILKHLIAAINLQDLGGIIKTLPHKLQQVVQNLLKTDPRIIQAQQQQAQQAQQQQQAANNAASGKGPTLQLKTFG